MAIFTGTDVQTLGGATFQSGVTSAAAGWISIQRLRWVYQSGGTATATYRLELDRSGAGTTPANQTPEKANTRSNPAGTFTKTWATNPNLATATAYVFLTGQAQGVVYDWIPPRPWAAYSGINGTAEYIYPAPDTNAACTCALGVHWNESPTVAQRRLTRRPRVRGLWHFAAHQNNLSGSQAIPRAQCPSPWVTYTRLNAEWRQFTNTPVQLGSLPPTLSTPLIVAQRFPMPEVYQRLATVSNNFGQVAFPLLGSWQPGTMDPPLVRAQYLLQEITPIPLPVGPPQALVPPPQPATTIPAISVAFYQQHPNPVTTPAAVTGIGGMTWYWP